MKPKKKIDKSINTQFAHLQSGTDTGATDTPVGVTPDITTNITPNSVENENSSFLFDCIAIMICATGIAMLILSALLLLPLLLNVGAGMVIGGVCMGMGGRAMASYGLFSHRTATASEPQTEAVSELPTKESASVP